MSFKRFDNFNFKPFDYEDYSEPKCVKCGEEFTPQQRSCYKEVCDKCIKENKEQIKREHLKRLDEDFTLQQRVRKIEEWIYDHEKGHPIPNYVMR